MPISSRPSGAPRPLASGVVAKPSPEAFAANSLAALKESEPFIKSSQPTLPGLGDDELAALRAACAADAVASAPPAASASSLVSAPARAFEPTMLEELDADFLIEERSGTLVDAYDVQDVVPQNPIPNAETVPPPSMAVTQTPLPASRPTPPIPLLRVVDSHIPAPTPAPVPLVAPPAPAAVAVMPSPFALAAQPAPQAPVRASLTDPMDVLFDAAYELCFAPTALEGANYCIGAAIRAVGARAALVHVVDGSTGEFVTVAALGEDAKHQIESRHEDDDWLISAAVFKGKPVTMEYGGAISSRPMPRHAFFGVQRNVVVVPVIGWGRALAVIELVDAADAALAGGRGENALGYLAQRFAEFLGEREAPLGTSVA